MIFNHIDNRFLIAAIITITSALAFYTIGVWGEKLQKKLKLWHIAFFLLGLGADTIGTTLMEHIASFTRLHDPVHTITGFIAIVLMFIHAVWAVWTYFRGTDKAKTRFNRFSIIVWFIWLIPYGIGVYLGITLHR